MTAYRLKRSKEFDAFELADGVDSYVTVVPSAAGMPLPSNLSPEASLDHSEAVFQAAGEALDDDMPLV